MSYKVTIVIPIYNVEPFIERCLLSAFNQSFESIEYLLIDDIGTDKSIEITKSVIQSHPRRQDIRIISHIHNQGLGATRNTGIANAKGEYIYFLDSDDAIPICAIEKLFKVVARKKVDVVVGSYNSVEYTSSTKNWGWTLENNLLEGEFSVANYYLNGGYYVMTWNKLYKTELLRRNHIYCIPESIHEDNFFSLQVALTAKSLETISDITYFYSLRTGSIMHVIGEKNFLHHVATFQSMVNFSKSFAQSDIYSKLIFFIYGQRFTWLKEINTSPNITLEKRDSLSRQITTINFLSFTEILSLKTTSISRKVTFLMSLFPYKLQLIYLRLTKYLLKGKK